MMARAGRKRKHGPRQPNGQPSRTGARENMLAVVRNQPHRKRFGDLSHDHRAECELGRLFMDSVIERHHYDAGVEYRRIVREMRIAIGAPPGTPSALDFDYQGGRGHDTDEDEDAVKRANRARSVYADAFAALGEAGRDAVLAVNDVVIWDKGRYEARGGVFALKRGLQVLARHLGLLGRAA